MIKLTAARFVADVREARWIASVRSLIRVWSILMWNVRANQILVRKYLLPDFFAFIISALLVFLSCAFFTRFSANAAAEQSIWLTT